MKSEHKLPSGITIGQLQYRLSDIRSLVNVVAGDVFVFGDGESFNNLTAVRNMINALKDDISGIDKSDLPF